MFVLEPGGLSDLNALIADLDARTKQAVAEALQEEMEDVLEVAQDLAPYEFGDLYRSGYVSEPTIGPDGVHIEIGFSAPYAREQHENLTYYHPGGKTAKYLEIPLMDWERDGAERVLDKAVEKLG